MKKYTFKDGFKCFASTKEQAIAKHKVMADKTFTVYVGDGEVNDSLLTIEEARKLAKSYRNKGYDDVKIVDTKTNKVTAAQEAKSKHKAVASGDKEYRITWRSEIFIKAKSKSEAERKFENLGLFSADALKLNAEWVETNSIEET